jgi:group I intron endonuclease
MAVIYRITNMLNNKYYIGSAQSFERRSWQHKYDLKKGVHKNPRLQAAWNKYGEDAFVFEVLEAIPDGQDQLAWENKYLHECVGKPDCYNINSDAQAPRIGKTHSAETKAKIKANRTAPKGESHYRYGQEVSDEVRAKISAAQKGRPNPRKGMPMSERGKANVVAAIKRGEESHFYGKRPTNADDMQRQIHAVKPDGTTELYPSLTYMRDTLGLSIATIIRACKSGNPIKLGDHAGWVLSYADSINAAPEIPDEHKHLPRSRAQAKANGAKEYFTGIPCDRGHIAPRKVKGACTECLKLEWAAQNKKRAEAKKVVDTP